MIKANYKADKKYVTSSNMKSRDCSSWKLPTFSGIAAEWQSLWDKFMAIVDQSELLNRSRV